MSANAEDMKRTKGTKNERDPELQVLQRRVQALSELTARAQIASRLGMSHDNKRDLYEALGYDLNPGYSDYMAQYRRQDIAKAVINRPVDATWRGPLTVLESDDDDETDFEKAWNKMYTRLSLKAKFIRLDKLAGIGKWGALLLGLDDVKKNLDFKQPVNEGNRKLVYLKPLGENAAEINSWDENPNSERFGQPLTYNVSILNPGNQAKSSTSEQIVVHHTRVIHVPGELLENEVEGMPRLEAIFNRLKDLEKLTGGSAEMFWKGARPGYQGKVDPEYTMTDSTKEDLKDQISEFEHNLRRILVNEGVSLESLDQQVSDPSNHVHVQLQMISSITGIPIRVLTGSERGELASTEDRNNWFDLVQTRREEFAEPQIVRQFVDKMIKYGVFPEPSEGYTVQWQDLWSMSDEEKAEIGKTKSEALKNYVSVPGAMDVLPPDSFYEHILGMGSEQIELINEQRGSMIQEEDEDFQNVEEGGDEE